MAGSIVSRVCARTGRAIDAATTISPTSEKMVYTPRETEGRPRGSLTRAQNTTEPHGVQCHEEGRMDLVFATYGSWSHLVVRMGLGVIFFAHGAQKVMGWFGGRGLKATIDGFRGMGIPPAAAALAAFIEFLGGLAMLAGFLARPAALGLIVVM